MPETTARSSEAPSIDALTEGARRAVETALAAGASDAVAGLAWERGVSYEWRDGRLEKVQEDVSRGLGISLYVDDRYSTHGTNDLDPDRLDAFVRDAVALTRYLEPDPHRRIPDPSLYTDRPTADLDLEDARIPETGRDDCLALCAALDEAARSAADVLSASSMVSFGHGVSARVSSNGFAGGRRSTFETFGASVTVKDGDEKRPEAGFSVCGVHQAGLPLPPDVGAEALRRALARKGSRSVPSRRTRLVVDPEAGGRLLAPLLGALSAGSVQQQRSFLAGEGGRAIASSALTIVDDPLVPRGLGSRHYDGEGISSRRMPVVSGGVLESFYVDTYYGRKLGWAPTTGSASNVLLEGGAGDLASILAEAGEGIYVTSWLGGNSDMTSGDFSYGLRGHVIRAGKLAEPVSEMNVTGNYRDLLRRLARVGADPTPYSSFRTPTLLFEDVQFSG